MGPVPDGQSRPPPPQCPPDGGNPCGVTHHSRSSYQHLCDPQNQSEVCLKSGNSPPDHSIPQTSPWSGRRHIFQATLLFSFASNREISQGLALSDSGSSIAFVCKQFMADHGINPYRVWNSSVQTMYSVTEVKTPFYKVMFSLKNNDKVHVWMLGTDSIGKRGRISPEIIEEISKIFKVSTASVFSTSGPIQFLLGQESNFVYFIYF